MDRSGLGRSPGLPGGDLVVALRAEPQTLNPVLALDVPSRTVLTPLMSTLVFVDRETLKPVPALAESWTISSDGRRMTFELRQDVRFSDGHPFDADDVVFTFEVFLDKKVGSSYRSNLMVGGEPIRVRKTDTHRVEIELAEPDAGGVRIVDAISILPRHNLEEDYREGRFAEAWQAAGSDREVVGLGPFRFQRHVPGERLELERNPHYWKVDGSGRRLPYLEKLTFIFVPDEEARVLRFLTGDSHTIYRVNGKTFNQLARESKRDYVLRDLGPGFDFHFLFFNLNDVESDRLPEVARKQTWFRRRVFRQAVSAAIDREAIARLVFDRRATPISSHITAGNQLWINTEVAPPRHSPESARTLLGKAGFTWASEGTLIGPDGEEVTFSIAVNSGNQEREGMAAVIQEDLRRIGVEVRVVTMEFRALVDRLTSTFDYEACILSFSGSIDPNTYLSAWRSDGPHHLWRLTRTGHEPAWQVRIDQLMQEQQTEPEYDARKKIYDEVQMILAQQEPYILLVSPNVLVGASRNLGNFTPSILEHPILWNVDELFWKEEGTPSRL